MNTTAPLSSKYGKHSKTFFNKGDLLVQLKLASTHVIITMHGNNHFNVHRWKPGVNRRWVHGICVIWNQISRFWNQRGGMVRRGGMVSSNTSDIKSRWLFDKNVGFLLFEKNVWKFTTYERLLKTCQKSKTFKLSIIHVDILHKFCSFNNHVTRWLLRMKYMCSASQHKVFWMF